METWQAFVEFLIPVVFAAIIGAYESGIFKKSKEPDHFLVFQANIIDVDHPDANKAYFEYYKFSEDDARHLIAIDTNLKSRYKIGPPVNLTSEQEKYPFIGIYRKVTIRNDK